MRFLKTTYNCLRKDLNKFRTRLDVESMKPTENKTESSEPLSEPLQEDSQEDPPKQQGRPKGSKNKKASPPPNQNIELSILETTFSKYGRQRFPSTRLKEAEAAKMIHTLPKSALLSEHVLQISQAPKDLTWEEVWNN